MSPQPRIYLDHAATTPILPEAKAAVIDAMNRWANPSSPHAEGRAARAALEEARARIKRALGWSGELIFTSGATEAIEIALGRTDSRILASAVEHDAIFRAAPGAELLPIGVRAQVDRDALAAALATSGGPPLVAIQHVNSETGVEQPVSQLASMVRESGGLLLSDCSQSAGKVPLPDADMLVVSAHKLGGPPGIGALLVKDLAMLTPRGGQEMGYRGGTQNVPAALGFAAAVEAFEIGTVPGSPSEALPAARWILDMADAYGDLEYPVRLAGGGYQPTGTAPDDMPMMKLGIILAISMPGVSSQAQLIRFDAAGIAVSAGSACSSGSLKTSRALAAFGVPEHVAACTIRVSFGWSTTAQDVCRFRQAWLEMAASAKSRAA